MGSRRPELGAWLLFCLRTVLVLLSFFLFCERPEARCTLLVGTALAEGTAAASSRDPVLDNLADGSPSKEATSPQENSSNKASLLKNRPKRRPSQTENITPLQRFLYMNGITEIVLLITTLLIIYAANLVNQYTLVDDFGLAVLPITRNYALSTSGDPRVIGAPRNGVVLSPFNTIDSATAITAAVRTSMARSNVSPEIVADNLYITGDDFSVVIPGRNEDDYIVKTLIYTFENTPPENLKEIIVVDDASDVPVETIIQRDLPTMYKSKVRVFRFEKAEGLIRARIFGANQATASNIFFLDGHCRPKPGWIQPLLRHLKANWRRIVCPVIQDISRATWEDTGTFGTKMMFEWTFEFGWYDDLTSEVPISSGGILALTKKWWLESGQYDDGMLEWGGENLEQSLRAWMCGGEIYVASDSFVGHIFDRPAKPNPGNKLVVQVQKNQKRCALVWLDEYYKYFEFFHSITKSYTDIGPGVEGRKALRRRLRCRDFQWYVNRFRSSFERKKLLVDEFKPLVHVASRFCLTTAIRESADPTVVLVPCAEGNLNQHWAPVAGGRMLMNQATGQCLDGVAATSYFAGPHTPVEVKECAWTELFLGRAPQQLWQVDGSYSGRIYSAPHNQNHSTLTGNDVLSVSTEAAMSPKSYCLASNLRFWDLNRCASCAPALNNALEPVPVKIMACTEATSFSDVAQWDDDQRFQWLL